jgi:hypothetical protein
LRIALRKLLSYGVSCALLGAALWLLIAYVFWSSGEVSIALGSLSAILFGGYWLWGISALLAAILGSRRQRPTGGDRQHFVGSSRFHPTANARQRPGSAANTRRNRR